MKSNFKVLLKFLIPSISTNICIFLFGIIDGIFVGNGVGTNALGAINIVWPFIMINYALTVLTSFGGITLTAIKIGERDYKKANNYFNISLILTFLISLFMMIIGIVFTKQIGYFLGSTETYIIYVTQYLFWSSVFIIPNSIGVCLEHFCRNDNDPNLVLFSTIISTSLNIFLDYLFIFPFRLGISGAAIATGISETVRFTIILFHYFNNRGILKIQLTLLRSREIKEILIQGSPEMIAQFASPVNTLCMNIVLGKFLGSLGINSFAIISYIASFTLSIMYGCSEGSQPLFGQCYGSKQYKRLNFFFNSSLLITIIGSTVCLFLVIIFIKPLCYIYKTDTETTNYIIHVLPQFSWGFILAGINALISTFLYSIKKTIKSIRFNIYRSFLINSICIILLPELFGKVIIWFSYGISECLILLIGIHILSQIKILRFSD